MVAYHFNMSTNLEIRTKIVHNNTLHTNQNDLRREFVSPEHAATLFLRVYESSFRGISPLKWGTMSTKPPKGTSLRESASFEPSSVKIRRRV